MEVGMKIRLSKEEREIENSIETFRSIRGAKRRKIERFIARVRKNRNINIRISEETIAALKRRAEQEGLPYQTLIASILHKYVSERLVEYEAVSHAMQFLARKSKPGQKTSATG
jgi:predicted DNA binding CopG/RHH family protein